MCVSVFQGSADNFLPQKQLLPENLVEACKESNVPIVLRSQEVGLQVNKRHVPRNIIMEALISST